MKNKIILLVGASLIFSCQEKEKVKEIGYEMDTIEKIETSYDNVSKDSLLFEDDILTSKTDFIIQGDGVVNINISQELTIYNNDDSLFGKIMFSEESESYVLEMPKVINARYFVPMLDQFYFDAKNPNTDDSYLYIYINSEVKKVKKTTVDFNFVTWENYLKSNFITLRKMQNNDQLDKYIYQVLNVEKDSISIKSIAKEECDAVELYKDVSKKIRWKDNDLLLINFYECN